MYAGPVSEVYRPLGDNQLIDELVPPNSHYLNWGYTVGYEQDAFGNDTPDWANTAVFRIAPGAMTEPVYVTKSQLPATFAVKVLAGQGRLIRSYATGMVEELSLQQGTSVTICPGQAYTYVNAGREDLVLHDVAKPAFLTGDEVDLTTSFIPKLAFKERTASHNCLVETIDGQQRNVILPTAFWDLVGQAMLVPDAIPDATLR